MSERSLEPPPSEITSETGLQSETTEQNLESQPQVKSIRHPNTQFDFKYYLNESFKRYDNHTTAHFQVNAPDSATNDDHFTVHSIPGTGSVLTRIPQSQTDNDTAPVLSERISIPGSGSVLTRPTASIDNVAATEITRSLPSSPRIPRAVSIGNLIAPYQISPKVSRTRQAISDSHFDVYSKACQITLPTVNKLTDTASDSSIGRTVISNPNNFIAKEPEPRIPVQQFRNPFEDYVASRYNKNIVEDRINQDSNLRNSGVLDDDRNLSSRNMYSTSRQNHSHQNDDYGFGRQSSDYRNRDFGRKKVLSAKNRRNLNRRRGNSSTSRQTPTRHTVSLNTAEWTDSRPQISIQLPNNSVSTDTQVNMQARDIAENLLNTIQRKVFLETKSHKDLLRQRSQSLRSENLVQDRRKSFTEKYSLPHLLQRRRSRYGEVIPRISQEDLDQSLVDQSVELQEDERNVKDEASSSSEESERPTNSKQFKIAFKKIKKQCGSVWKASKKKYKAMRSIIRSDVENTGSRSPGRVWPRRTPKLGRILAGDTYSSSPIC